MKREVRVLLVPHDFVDAKWIYLERPIVRLGDVGAWTMVRHAEHSQAAPFVISRKDWDRLQPAGDAP